MNSRIKISVRGVVQGVGFRPFVYSLAKSLNLKGFVMNSSKGVTIEIEGNDSSLFVERLKNEAPPLSKIMNLDVSPLPYHGYKDFQIVESEDEGSFTLISPDVSVCKNCFRELLSVNDRRYLYPFINCTNCGPRYTITRSVPYDRPNTTMSVFQMCAECNEEYHNPGDRRFHAQPNACPVCGPHVKIKIINKKLKRYKNENPIALTIKMLKEGYIVAIKGLGGFHLACDASNERAVNMLRLRKRKSNKPFALMAPDVKTVRKFCNVSSEEENLLLSIKRPIVLLTKKGNLLPEEVSPKNPCIGFMLPYTPLHYLLFYYPFNSALRTPNSRPRRVAEATELQTNFDALVMTSGNLSEEPIVTDNEEAFTKLSGIADAFLVHNRHIFMRVDDSVVRVMPNNSSFAFIRRSRGYVPDPILLHEDGPEVLGCGADIKNIFTLTKGSFAIPSQHIGDMENYETLQFFEESLRNLKDVYRVHPVALAYDLHPMYLSTQWALRQEDIQKIGIQHHYAHVASVMAEKGIKEKVLGVSFDGTGYGTDGNLWGAEFLTADIEGFTRVGHFKYIPLPGGEVAVKEPWRIAVSLIKDVVGDETIPYLQSIGFIEKYGVIKRLSQAYSINDVVLCGGVFQNMYLLERAMSSLVSTGMKVHIHDKVPTNDAGISLGQAYIIRERIKKAA